MKPALDSLRPGNPVDRLLRNCFEEVLDIDLDEPLATTVDGNLIDYFLPSL